MGSWCSTPPGTYMRTAPVYSTCACTSNIQKGSSTACRCQPPLGGSRLPGASRRMPFCQATNFRRASIASISKGTTRGVRPSWYSAIMGSIGLNRLHVFRCLWEQVPAHTPRNTASATVLQSRMACLARELQPCNIARCAHKRRRATCYAAATTPRERSERPGWC